MVVAVGLTLNEPLADAGVNAPGAMARLVAPVVAQLKVLLEPAATAAGLAVKEVIVGLLPGLPAVFTVMVSVEVVEPAALVAVSV